MGETDSQESQKEGKAVRLCPKVSQDGHLSPPLTWAAGEGAPHGE